MRSLGSLRVHERGIAVSAPIQFADQLERALWTKFLERIATNSSFNEPIDMVRAADRFIVELRARINDEKASAP